MASVASRARIRRIRAGTTWVPSTGAAMTKAPTRTNTQACWASQRSRSATSSSNMVVSANERAELVHQPVGEIHQPAQQPGTRQHQGRQRGQQPGETAQGLLEIGRASCRERVWMAGGEDAGQRKGR